MAVRGSDHDGCACIAGFKQTSECGASVPTTGCPGWEMGICTPALTLRMNTTADVPL